MFEVKNMGGKNLFCDSCTHGHQVGPKTIYYFVNFFNPIFCFVTRVWSSSGDKKINEIINLFLVQFHLT